MYYIAVCDDEKYTVRQIERYLYQMVDSEDDIQVSSFTTGKEFCDSLDAGNYYDLVFMDYEMDGVDGLSAGLYLHRNTSTRNTLLIYVSSHSEVVMRLLDAEIFHFIEKPINFEKFEKLVWKAFARMNDNSSVLEVHWNKKISYIPMANIVYLESSKRIVRIVTLKETVVVYEKLDNLEEKLKNKSNRFARVHKSYIVNFDHTQKIMLDQIVLYDGFHVPVSRKFSEKIKLDFMNYSKRKSI